MLKGLVQIKQKFNIWFQVSIYVIILLCYLRKIHSLEIMVRWDGIFTRKNLAEPGTC